jgi:hypothetical protein
MDSDQMSKILLKIGLVHVVGKFQKETISPEIVHMLSEYEMKLLGLHKSDIMKLPVYYCQDFLGTSRKRTSSLMSEEFSTYKLNCCILR